MVCVCVFFDFHDRVVVVVVYFSLLKKKKKNKNKKKYGEVIVFTKYFFYCKIKTKTDFLQILFEIYVEHKMTLIPTYKEDWEGWGKAKCISFFFYKKLKNKTIEK